MAYAIYHIEDISHCLMAIYHFQFIGTINWNLLFKKLGVPGWGRHFLSLAAAAVVVAAAVITAATVVSSAVVATAAEQDQQNDDPAPVTTTEAVIAHTNTST